MRRKARRRLLDSDVSSFSNLAHDRISIDGPRGLLLVCRRGHESRATDFSQKGPRWRWSTPIRLAPAGADRSTNGAARRSKPTPNVRSGSSDNGQFESALKPLEDGLAKVPANPWLLTRKALVQLQLNQLDAARLTLRNLLQNHPDNLGGSILLTRLVARNRRPRLQGAAQFQQALSATSGRRTWAARRRLPSFVGSALGQAGFCAAALKHLELAGRLQAEAS